MTGLLVNDRGSVSDEKLMDIRDDGELIDFVQFEEAETDDWICTLIR